MSSFEAFPKIRRIFKDNMIITEKIDGSNAQICISSTAHNPPEDFGGIASADIDGVHYTMWAGSRTRWITPGKNTDNFGFAAWAKDNAAELFKLGEGRHYGEWWGQGIQRGYGQTTRRFSLFNSYRWSGNNASLRPACCDVVPVLGCWTMDTARIKEVLEDLKKTGSIAAPGFMDVEGIVVYHPASNQLFKYTVDDNHKDTPKDE